MSGRTIHVEPVSDHVAHDTSSDDCLCGPDIEYVDGGGKLVVHHSLDGREAYEPPQGMVRTQARLGSPVRVVRLNELRASVSPLRGRFPPGRDGAAMTGRELLEQVCDVLDGAEWGLYDCVLLTPAEQEKVRQMGEDAKALYEQVQMDESVGICLSDRVACLRLGDSLGALALLAEPDA